MLSSWGTDILAVSKYESISMQSTRPVNSIANRKPDGCLEFGESEFGVESRKSPKSIVEGHACVVTQESWVVEGSPCCACSARYAWGSAPCSRGVYILICVDLGLPRQSALAYCNQAGIFRLRRTPDLCRSVYSRRFRVHSLWITLSNYFGKL